MGLGRYSAVLLRLKALVLSGGLRVVCSNGFITCVCSEGAKDNLISFRIFVNVFVKDSLNQAVVEGVRNRSTTCLSSLVTTYEGKLAVTL
jgi:hypothetical protein